MIKQRVLLLIPSHSYRASDFLDAARALQIEAVVGSDHRPVLQAFARGSTITVDFNDTEASIARIVQYQRDYPIDAVIGSDDGSVLLAAQTCQVLGLRGNNPKAIVDAHDKYRFRTVLEQAGLRSPWFSLLSSRGELRELAHIAPYPCVLKPLALSASRGVIRADDAAAFVAAGERIAAILRTVKSTPNPAILAEAFIPGREVALEGILNDGRLQVLALFDKPDPLDGPFFEETIYITPSRLPDDSQQKIIDETGKAAAALGLRQGPVHAELRIDATDIWMIELAARSIGGLCSRSLLFDRQTRLEQLILRNALGLPPGNIKRSTKASGVMMIPIPQAGRLRAVQGTAEARRQCGIEDLVISIAPGETLVPLPEGDRYLGFIFARAESAQDVEHALHAAHRKLRFDIEPDSG